VLSKPAGGRRVGEQNAGVEDVGTPRLASLLARADDVAP